MLGVLLALAADAALAQAADTAFAFAGAPGTGDPAMDARLADIAQYGDRYREAFVDELVRYHAGPRALAGALLEDERWSPGDLYYACVLAEVVGRPCRHVIDLWRERHAEGWEAIAARLGVAPGAPAFVRIGTGIEASYLRWGRPLPDVPASPTAPATAGDDGA